MASLADASKPITVKLACSISDTGPYCSRIIECEYKVSDNISQICICDIIEQVG